MKTIKTPEVIHKIIDRYETMTALDFDKLSLEMDLLSVHLTRQMDWERLLKADNYNFIHDVTGIMIHIDRTSFPGELGNHFIPRFEITNKK